MPTAKTKTITITIMVNALAVRLIVAGRQVNSSRAAVNLPTAKTKTITITVTVNALAVRLIATSRRLMAAGLLVNVADTVKSLALFVIVLVYFVPLRQGGRA